MTKWAENLAPSTGSVEELRARTIPESRQMTSDERPDEKLRNAIEQVRKTVKCLALEVPPTVLADVSSQVEALIAVAYAENTRAELNTRKVIPHAPAADRPVELRKAIDALLISVEALRDARPVEIQAKKRTVEAARAGIEERFASLLAKLIESELEKYTLQNGEIDELALWPDGRVTLIGGKEDYGYEVISVRKLLEGRQKT